MNTCSIETCDRPRKGHGYCDPHYQRWLKCGDPRADVPIRPSRDPRPGHLWCRACGQEKPDAEMTAAGFVRRKGWRTSECKQCKSLRNPQSPETKRKNWLSGAYGLTVEQYEQRLSMQGGVCAICSRPPRKNRLHVDHDHACCPGKRSCGKCIRGLVCSGCNSRIEWWLTYHKEIAAYLA